MTPLRPDMGDDIHAYKTALWFRPGQLPKLILDRLPNGDCVYLDEATGCTIHDRAPWTCRTFDCRETFRSSDRPGRRLAVKSGEMTKEIFARGRKLTAAEKQCE